MASIIALDEARGYGVLQGASCAFGVFDGVHRGHRFIIDQAIRHAEDGGSSTILTFDIDPEELFAPDRLKKLMTNEQRIATLADTGADIVAVLSFTREFSQLEPRAFLESVFGANLPASIHVGCDFRFGHRAQGDMAMLKGWGAQRGVGVHAYELLEYGGEPITSTRIRQLIDEGDVELAQMLLDGKDAQH